MKVVWGEKTRLGDLDVGDFFFFNHGKNLYIELESKY